MEKNMPSSHDVSSGGFEEELYLIPVSENEDIDMGKVFDHLKMKDLENEKYFIYRYPSPTEFIDRFPDYVLIHDKEIGIFKKGTETLQIVTTGIYRINHEKVNPSTNYLVFISLTDFHLEWEIEVSGQNEKTSNKKGKFKVSGTIIIEPKDVALLAYNLILITRGLQIEFNEWINDQIAGIFKENKEIRQLVEKKNIDIESLTIQLQENLEKDLNFVGIELKGVQISEVIRGEFKEQFTKSYGVSAEKKEVIPKKRVNHEYREEQEKAVGGQVSSSEEQEVLMEVNVPDKLVIGVPVEIEAVIKPVKKVDGGEAIIVAYSPSFLIISNDKKVLLDKKIHVKFQAVPISLENPSITINLFSDDGRLISQKIVYDLKIEKGVESTLKFLLKMFGFAGIIIVLNYFIALLFSPFLSNPENLGLTTSFAVGVIIGLLLSALIVFTELRKKS